MKFKFKNIILLFFLSIIFSITSPTSFADEDSDLEEYVNAASFMLEANRDYFSKQTISKLEKWISKSKMILEKNKTEKLKAMDLEYRLRDDIGKNLQKRNDHFKIYVDDYIKEKKIHDIFADALKENRYFYYAIYKGANISTNYYNDTDSSGANFVESVDFSMTYRQTKEDEEKIEKFVDDWIKNNIKDKMDEVLKIKNIHDFIVKKNSYYTGDENDKSKGYSIYSPASILFGNGGVCNAYATLFDKIAEKSGIKTYYSTGTIKENSQLHIWNMVKIKDDWYNLDITWDDPVLKSDNKIKNEKEYVSYEYFLISDDQIRKSRTIDQDEKRPLSVKSYDHGFKTTKIEFE